MSKENARENARDTNAKETRRRALDLLERRPDISQVMLVAYTKLATSTGLNFLAGIADFSPMVHNEFERVLNLIDQGDILHAGAEPVNLTDELTGDSRVQRGRGKARDFYVTQTSRKVSQVLDYCGLSGLIGIITGDYGVGKTEAVNHWRKTAGAKIPHLVFEFDDFSGRNVLEFLRGLSEALSVPVGKISQWSGGPLMQALIQHLQEEPVLLIFDQCEVLSARIFQVIRQIWDKSKDKGVGVVFLAAPLLLDRLMKSARDLGALTSRVGVWLRLQGISRTEAEQVLAKEGVTNIDAEALDLMLRATGGSMRRLMAVASMLVVKHAGKTVTVKTIEGVAANLWGMYVAGPRKEVMT